MVGFVNMIMFIFVCKIGMFYKLQYKTKANIYAEWHEWLGIGITFEENKDNQQNLLFFIWFWPHI